MNDNRGRPAPSPPGDIGPATSGAKPENKLVITDYVVDPTGDLAVAIAVKQAELAGKGRRRRRRPQDVAFDEALMAELASRRIPFGLTQACVETAVEVAAKGNKHLSPEGARSRVVLLLRRSREKSDDA